MSVPRIMLAGVLGLLLLAAASCAPRSVRPTNVPAPSESEVGIPIELEAKLASDYPEFVVTSMKLRTQGSPSGQSGIVGATVLLEHKRVPFRLVKEYGRSDSQGSVRDWSEYVLGDSGHAQLFRGRLDRRMESFVEWFSRTYPHGKYVCFSVRYTEDVGTRQRFNVWFNPREDWTQTLMPPELSSGSHSLQALYDPASNKWSQEPL